MRSSRGFGIVGVLGALALSGYGGEVTAVRHEELHFGDDWFATATPYGKPEQADADATWIPAAWRDEGDPP